MNSSAGAVVATLYMRRLRRSIAHTRYWYIQYGLAHGERGTGEADMIGWRWAGDLARIVPVKKAHPIMRQTLSAATNRQKKLAVRTGCRDTERWRATRKSRGRREVGCGVYGMEIRPYAAGDTEHGE